MHIVIDVYVYIHMFMYISIHTCWSFCPYLNVFIHMYIYIYVCLYSETLLILSRVYIDTDPSFGV